MARNSGERTKRRILQVAETLFAQYGFDGTSVDRIARQARVNKALIYYYFEDKRDIIRSLFESIVTELGAQLAERTAAATARGQQPSLRQTLAEEIQLLQARRGILSVVLMEALQGKTSALPLFDCADLVIAGEASEGEPTERGSSALATRHRAFEFFTGFLPLVAFVALGDKWSRHEACSRDQALEYFLDAFERSHLSAHRSDE